MTENNDTHETETETETETTDEQTQTAEQDQTPPQAAPDDTMNVDLSPDDAPAQDAAQRPQQERHVATQTQPQPQADPNAGGDTDDYDAAGEAERLIKNSDGDTPNERSKNAIEQVQQHLKQITQRLQHVRKRESDTEERIEDLQEARVHVRRAPDDLPVFRSFGGGITVGVAAPDEYGSPDEDERVPDEDAGTDGHADVPDEGGVEPGEGVAEFSGVYDRDDLIRDIDDTLESEQQTLAGLREEQGKLSRGIGNAEEIQRELQDYREKSQWLTQDDTQGQAQGQAQAGGHTHPTGGAASSPQQNATPTPPANHGGGTAPMGNEQRDARTGGQSQPRSQPQTQRQQPRQQPQQGQNMTARVNQTREATPQELAEERQRGRAEPARGRDADADADRGSEEQ